MSKNLKVTFMAMRDNVIQVRLHTREKAVLNQLAIAQGYGNVSAMIRDLPNLYQQGNFENVSKTNYIT
jgi:hypothetical protein